MSGGGDQSQDLDAWLAPFLAVMGRKTRRAWAPLYLRGLLGPGDRKSLQPMAARLGLGQQPPPAGRGGLLVGEWRSSGERKYYLSNLPPRTSRRALAGTIKARWVCEQARQQLKEDLGLDHFEGRSWTGLHRHALMTCIACAYLQDLRLAEHRRTGRGKNDDPPSGSAAVTELARRATGHHRTAVRPPRPARLLPALPTPVPLALRYQSAQLVV